MKKYLVLVTAALCLLAVSCKAKSPAETPAPAPAQPAVAPNVVEEATARMDAAFDRKEIDDFLASYETFVGKLEDAKKNDDTTTLLSLSAQSADLSAKAQNLQGNAAWTPEDLAKYSALSAKMAAALQ